MHKITDALQLLHQAQETLAQIASVTDIDAVEGAWLIAMGDGEFVAEWSDQWCRLMLTANLGCVVSSAERTALNLLMSVNALWRDLGDLRLARDGDEGAFQLIGGLGADHSDPETFNDALLHFEAMRLWCVEALATIAAGASLPDMPKGASLLRI